MKTGIITLPAVPIELIRIMSHAWPAFCKEYDIPCPKVTFIMGGNGYIGMTSETIPKDKLGILEPCIRKAYFMFFNMPKWPAPQQPYLPATLNIRYELYGGGENGLPYYIEGSDTVYYGVVEEKWFSRPGMQKVIDPECKTCKPKKTLSAYYKQLFS
jgi:hypothetical protein